VEQLPGPRMYVQYEYVYPAPRLLPEYIASASGRHYFVEHFRVSVCLRVGLSVHWNSLIYFKQSVQWPQCSNSGAGMPVVPRTRSVDFLFLLCCCVYIVRLSVFIKTQFECRLSSFRILYTILCEFRLMKACFICIFLRIKRSRCCVYAL